MIINKFKKTKKRGYVSIETIIIAGLVIGIGVMAFMAFQTRANSVTNKSFTAIDSAQNSMTVKPVQ